MERLNKNDYQYNVALLSLKKIRVSKDAGKCFWKLKKKPVNIAIKLY